ncbi:hypothetical protein PoB_003807000 [Plakobranchus ocellatus]|uniref:Uncharacterized protein n=1 Tax=Plakobranchus ocellatus TaxID=259542 RepID=A0AAV4AXN3_9GAST|nr:hypothetical protein PoB_003807000 [Plakobranchus ocellatus]
MGSPISSGASEKPADATNNDNIRIIKYLKQVLMGLAPVISKMKSAHGYMLRDSHEESDSEGNTCIVSNDVASTLGMSKKFLMQ